MTIGERIQQYRKALGMSQEELGQNLFVSRQTVSQWETDQTLPTVDNLLRLKELFGVSVDAILEGQTEEEADEKGEEKPLETYRMTFTADELETRGKALLWKSSKPILCSLLLTILSFISLSGDQKKDMLLYILLGFFISWIIVNMVTAIRQWKYLKQENRIIADRIYHYSIFRDRYIAEIESNGELVEKRVVPFSDIKDIRNIGGLTVVSTRYRASLFKTSELPRDSAIIHLQNEIVLRTQFTKATGIWRFLSIALCVLSFVAWPLAMQIMTWNLTPTTGTVLSAAEGFRNSWIAYLFLPVPIASIVLGFILKKKHFYYKKNIIIGIFIIIPLCVFGSFFLIFTR